MSGENDDFAPGDDEFHGRTIAQSINDAGTLNDQSHQDQATVAGKIGDAERGNIKVRLIALENLVVALLASAPASQSEIVSEMAKFISPRSGNVPHRLTIEAARNMLALVERAAHYRDTRG